MSLDNYTVDVAISAFHVEVNRGPTVEVPRRTVNIVTAGSQGPPGPSGIEKAIIKVAGEALGGNRIVVLDATEKAFYANKSDLTNAEKILGVTMGAASLGANVTIQTYGEMEDSSFNFTLNQSIYVGLNGQMTQTPPTTGFLRSIGFPITATKLFIDLGVPIIL